MTAWRTLGNSGIQLVLAVPMDAAFAVEGRLNNTLIALAILAVSLALLLAVIAARSITQPLRTITRATVAMADGDLEQRIPVLGASELAQLAYASNRLAEELSSRIRALDEQIMHSRSVEAALLNQKMALDASALVSIADPSGSITHVNDQFCELSGYPRAQLLGAGHTQLSSGVHPHEFWIAFWRTISSGRIWRGEVCNRNASGALYWVQLSVVPILDEHRRPSEYLSVGFDITARRTAEDALSRNEQRLREILDTTTQGFWRHDADGVIREVNPRLGQILGVSVATLVGTRLHDHMSARDAGLCLNALTTPSGSSLSIELIARDGSHIPCLYSATALYGDRQLSGGFALMTDITEIHEKEQELTRARDLARDSAHAKAAFVANMSHEIRTPMNGLLGMLSVLRDTELNEEQRDYLDVATRSGDALLELLNGVLDLSKIEAGRLQLERIPFRLTQLVEDSVDLMATNAQDKGLAIAASVSPQLPIEVSGDPTRLRQIIHNLLGNAVKFTERGHVLLRVELVSHDDQELELLFEVEDTGVGIASEAQQAIFDDFTQADSSTTRHYGGTGLGLTLSRALVEEMGGRIGVRSEPGTGSTFWFTVRLQPCEHQRHQPDKDARFKGLQILVVDDQDIVRAVLGEQLRNLGCEVSEAEGMEQTLARLQDPEQPAVDIAIIDRMMPDHDGHIVAAAINELDLPSPVHMILLSSQVEFDHIEQARTLGFSGFLIKPVSATRLLAVIRDVMGWSDQPAAVTAESIDTEIGEDIRLLLAEDNPVNQKVARGLLKRLGVAVDIAGDGEEAVAMAAANDYAMIFMDLQMPRLGGLEATAHIRQQGGPRIPIVALTADANPKVRDRCLAVGMDDYLCKPFKQDELANMVSRWARRTEDESPDLNDYPLIDRHALDSLIEAVGKADVQMLVDELDEELRILNEHPAGQPIAPNLLRAAADDAAGLAATRLEAQCRALAAAVEAEPGDAIELPHALIEETLVALNQAMTAD